MTGRIAAMAGLLALVATADDRKFTFVQEPVVPHAGETEFEQWITGRFGHEEGNYARWDLREELEYGITDQLAGALYLNFTDIHEGIEDGEDKGLDFTGVSAELKYQITDPYTDPIGSLVYFEYTTDGVSHELEEKLVFGKEWDAWSVAASAVIEQEWEDEDGETEKESALEFGLGISRKLATGWWAGVEAIQRHGFLGTGLDEEEYSTTSVGPSLHFKRDHFHLTFTVLPQLHGTGDGAEDGLQRVHAEELQTRLQASIEF